MASFTILLGIFLNLVIMKQLRDFIRNTLQQVPSDEEVYQYDTVDSKSKQYSSTTSPALYGNNCSTRERSVHPFDTA